VPGLRPLRATDPRASITIGELAQRTGVPASTLRMWEARHGFPEPVRRPSGHRRYGEADVQLVRVVMRQRAAGLSLEGAIRRVRDPDRGAPISIFGALRQRWPELRPHTVAKPVLLALSRAVEDELRRHRRAGARDRDLPGGALLPAIGGLSGGRWFAPATLRSRWPTSATRGRRPARRSRCRSGATTR